MTAAIDATWDQEWVRFLLILGAFIVLSRLFLFMVSRYVKRLTSKTTTTIDDELLNAVTNPLYVLLIIVGLYIALKQFESVEFLTTYKDWVDGTFFVLLTLIITLLLARVLGILITHWLRVQKRFEKTPKLLNRIVSVLVFVIAILMVLSHFGVDITAMVAAAGLGGLAIGLALQDTLSNFFSGVTIVSDKPINVGDFIELEGGTYSGWVEDIGWRSTRIKTLGNVSVVIPNSKLANSVISNQTLPDPQVSVVIQCGVAYTSDLEKVERVTIDVARKIQQTAPGAVRAHEPFIRYNGFGESNIDFSIILRAETFVDKYLMTHLLIKDLKAAYDAEGIEISWPVIKVYHSQ